jgi:Domain of unknown function (DUF4160)
MARELPYPVCTNHNIRAYILGTDHAPPHFHVNNRKIWTVRVAIETGQYLKRFNTKHGPTPKEREQIEGYRLQHLDLLRGTWRAKHGPEQ